MNSGVLASSRGGFVCDIKLQREGARGTRWSILHSHASDNAYRPSYCIQ